MFILFVIYRFQWFMSIGVFFFFYVRTKSVEGREHSCVLFPILPFANLESLALIRNCTPFYILIDIRLCNLYSTSYFNCISQAK